MHLSTLAGATSVLFALAAAQTAQLPASPTGSICEPHGDHWDCKPSPTKAPAAATTVANVEVTTTTEATATCEAHGDHWHCPSGVPEPTHLPGQGEDHDHDHDHDDDHVTPTATCEPHGDHWHCPSGVPEPTQAPADEDDHDHDHAEATSTCEPHGDHWHCPSGVPEPTYMPSVAQSTTTFATTTTSSRAPSGTVGNNSTSGTPAVTVSEARKQVVPFVAAIGAVLGLSIFV